MQSDKMNTRREKIMYQVLKLSMPQARVEKKIFKPLKDFVYNGLEGDTYIAE